MAQKKWPLLTGGHYFSEVIYTIKFPLQNVGRYGQVVVKSGLTVYELFKNKQIKFQLDSKI